MYTFNLTLKRPKKQLLLKQNLSLFKATNPITHQNQNHFGTYQYDYQLELGTHVYMEKYRHDPRAYSLRGANKRKSSGPARLARVYS